MKYGPYSAISVRIDNGILLLTLDRPEQLNTFTSAMMNELVDVFTLVNEDDAVRVVVVGVATALEWCLTGDLFDAQHAKAAGLASAIVEPAGLLDHAFAIAARIRDNTAPVSVALTRQMLWRVAAQDHPMEAHKIDSRGIYVRGQSAASKEDVSSFLERRPPVFRESVSIDMPRFFPWWKPRT